MKRSLLVLCAFLLAGGAFAQDPATGFPPYGSFEYGGLDAVNRQNLNVNFTIPVVSVPGRGLDFSHAIVYDSLIWRISGGAWTPVVDQDGNPRWGWKKDIPGGRISYRTTTRTTKCFDEYGGWFWGTITTWSGYVYLDVLGTNHGFPVSITEDCNGGMSGTFTGYATDGSGYYLDATTPTGPVVTSPGGIKSPSGSVADTNGNLFTKIVVSSTETDWKDTAGHVALKVSTGPSSMQYQFQDSTGAFQTTTLNLQSFNIKTNFACTGVVEYTGTASLPVSMVLPNGRSYQFTYEPTPGDPTSITGRVQQVTLPTGGTYTYEYLGANDSINCADGTVTNLKRTLSDGAAPAVWQFVRTQIDASTWKIRLTPPGLSYDGNVPNESVFIFTNGRETSQKIYQGLESGNVVLRTINTAWAANGTPASKTIVLEDGLTQSQVETVFDTYGNLTELRERAWGTGAPGAVLRTTQMSYLATTPYTTRNIRNRVKQIRVHEGGPTGVIKSQTDLVHDEAAYSNVECPTGIPQHDDANYGCGFTTRGNPTTVTTYANAAAQTGAVTRHSYYDFFGNVRRADVSCCQQKQSSYSAATNFAYPDSVVSGPPTGQQLTTSATYNPYTGLVMSTTDENNKVTSFSYDTLKRLIDIQRPDNAHITYNYDDAARKIAVNTPIQGTDVLTQTTEHDGLARAVKRTVSGGLATYSVVETQYDVLGQPYKQSNPHNSTAQYWTETRFDALGRPTMVIPPDGSPASNRTTYTYSGTTVTVTDPTGKQRKSETDALGRLIKVTEPDANGLLNVDTTYGYTVLDALATVTQGVQTRTYTYDDLGRLLTASTPETNNQLVSYQYNDFGLVTQRTDPRSVITNYSYDTLNRLQQISYNVGTTGVPATPTVNFTYGTDPLQNNNGRLLTMTDGVGSESYTYDLLGRVTQVQKVISGTNYTMRYAYNLAGELTSIAYPSNRVVQQSYDMIGRLSAIASGTTNYASAFSYNQAGQVTGFNYGNGVTTSLGYSPERLQLQTLSYTKPGQTLFSLSYGYLQNGGNNGQISSITNNVDATRSMTYSYDPLGRLKVAFAGPEANPTWKLDWDYDRYGNRPNQNVRAGSPPGPQLTIDPNTNRITGTGYGYDANGNITADGLNSLTHDAENRTVSVNGTTSYFYDGNSLRVKKVSGATTVYIFSGTKVIAEYENGAAPGSPTREYIHSGNQLLAKIEGGATQYYHGDHLSVRVITDSNGTKIGERGHYPFGDAQPWYETGTITKWKFTTYERDGESVNDYAMARYYINRLGRFGAPDPIAGSISDPQSLNRYVYVRNDPVDFVDPLGLVCSWNINEQGQLVAQCTVYAIVDDRFFLEWAGCAYLGICPNDGSQGGDVRPDPGRDRGDREQKDRKCPPPKTGGGIVIFAQASAAVGLIATGAAAQGSVGLGGFYNSQGGISGGLVASGGATAYAGKHVAGIPSQKDKPFVFGAYAGYGPGILVTNAGSADQLKGPFQTLNIDIGFPFLGKASIQAASSGGIWTFSVSGGPSPYANGGIFDVSYYTTNTAAVGTNSCP